MVHLSLLFNSFTGDFLKYVTNVFLPFKNYSFEFKRDIS